MLWYVRRNCARKSPTWTVSLFSSMLAVPEMSNRIATSPNSMRSPREKELGLA